MTPRRAVALDLDGTLVDSVHVHVVAWHEALLASGRHVPMARIHAGIGMGGDRLVAWLLGGRPDDATALADHHRERFLDRAELLRPTPGADALLADLAEREVPHLIATSAGTEERQALLECLDASPPLIDGDAVASSKPAPDVVHAAAGQLDVLVGSITMVGDAVWDVLAARAAGAAAVGVRCGGTAATELRDAGAVRVVDDPAGLVGTL